MSVLRKIKLNNFLSVQESELEFSESGMNVLIGANQSGKSNFVKALEFIAELGKSGLSNAIYNLGRREGVLPKSIPRADLKRAETQIEYTIGLPRPEYYPDEAQDPTVSHSFRINWVSNNRYNISQEVLEFHEPISMARARRRARSVKNGKEAKVEYLQSSLKVERSRRRTCKFILTPDFDVNNTKDLIYWFGFDPYLEKSSQLQTPMGFKKFLSDVSGTYINKKSKSLIEDQTFRLMDDSEDLLVFKKILARIKRYDLQLVELRREQPAVEFEELGNEGQYLPAALKMIETKPSSRSRIRETLMAIAPQIADYDIAALRTGRDYLEFFERKGGRPVESWLSSDGTLRALAILVAIESARDNQVIIIEEPELCLHPWAIKILMDHIRNVIEEEQRNLQAIITTHSQQVLECVKPEQVVIVSRALKGGTRFIKLTDISSKARIDVGEVGRLWVKGLLGGVPEYEE